MMKKNIILLLSLCCCGYGRAQSYQVNLTVKGYSSGIAYFAYHMGANFNVVDSAAINNKGEAQFTGKERLPGGIYSIVFPGKTQSIDFLVDKEQKISIVTDASDPINKTVIAGSKENNLFQQYQKTVAEKGRLLQEEKIAYTNAKNKADSQLHEKNYLTYSAELNDYRNNIIKNEPSSMMAVLLNAMKDPALPTKQPITHQDSVANYYYYKAHYWDGITFLDERVIRTPFFLPRLEKYYREVLTQSPDSIIREVDYHLLLARTCPEMYKFLLNWFTDEYYNPKYMGQDAVFVHLFENYHSKGISNWLNDDQKEKVSRRAYMLMANLIGEKGSDLEMIDSTGKPMPLYGVNAAYTVLVFWDPNCGHCREEIPRLDSIYQASWKKHNLTMYGVLTQDDKNAKKDDWVNYIREHKLGDWVNVYETKEMEAANNAAQKPSFRQLYDVTLTPTLYLLDKDKRIIGKKLTWQQLNDFLEIKWKTANP